MRLHILFILLAINISTLVGQNKIIFPNYADGAQHQIAKYGYLKGFIVEVSDTNLFLIYSDNGTIIDDKSYLNRYRCIPRQTGNFYVNAVYKKSPHNFDTVTKGIKVINFPKLKLIAKKTKLKGDIIINSILLDSANNDVTSQYNFCGVLKLWVNNEWYNTAMNNLKTIDLLKLISELGYTFNINNIKRIKIETFTIYSVETDLPVGLLNTEIKL
jgi:hypothetical protein